MSLLAAVEITAIGSGGDGLAQCEGQRIYVPFSLPGERIKARIDGERGTIERILRPSPAAVASFSIGMPTGIASGREP
jgi:23S rRNA (uracil1939-C5)-methyltransferase